MRILLAFLVLASVCQYPAPAAPLSPADARFSTFRVDLVGGGSGTAWVAENRDGHSYLVTAKHVCDDPVGYTLVAVDGSVIVAWEVKKSAKYDLCLLVTNEVVGPALALSPAPPYYDEPVMAVGAAQGVYGCDTGVSIDQCGVAPISRGWYAGGNLVSMPMAGGNSGSAVFTSRGVIGVLVEGYTPFDSLSFIEPLDHLREFVTSI